MNPFLHLILVILLAGVVARLLYDAFRPKYACCCACDRPFRYHGSCPSFNCPECR